MKERSRFKSYSLYSQPPLFQVQSPLISGAIETSDAYIKDLTNYPSVPVMGYNVYSGKLKDLQFSGTRTIVNTLNAHSFVVARKDESFHKALSSSDILIADGFPIVMAARILNSGTIYKIAGEDMFFFLLNQLKQTSGSCFFLGSSGQTLKKIQKRLKNEYPEVNARFFSPPFKQKFTDRDNLEMISRVNQFKPDVLFVGMTAPKQEKWVYENAPGIDARIICSIGAVFDFYARNITRPSKFWVSLRMEWFIRLLKEPKRLWRRYFVSSPVFFKYLLYYKTGILK